MNQRSCYNQMIPEIIYFVTLEEKKSTVLVATVDSDNILLQIHGNHSFLQLKNSINFVFRFIISGNDSNFVGANSQLQELYELLHNSKASPGLQLTRKPEYFIEYFYKCLIRLFEQFS